MKNDTYLYTQGLDTARREGDIALWRASYQANKGVGHLDPGAVTMSYQLECLCDYVTNNLL